MIIIIDLYYLIIDINDYYVSIIYRFITTFLLHYQYLQNTYTSMFKLSFLETENMRKSGGKNETFEQSGNKTGGWKICGLKLRNIQRGKLFVPTLDTDVSYICLLQFRRRLDKVWETVDELRPYLRSRFIQLKSKSYKATCSERPPETFLKETMCRLFQSPLLRDTPSSSYF